MTTTLAAGLGGHAVFLQWGVLQISLANFVVIVLMVIVLLLAVLIPFPHSGEHEAAVDEAPLVGTDVSD